MTAFANAEHNDANTQLRIEIRSVNHRFLELALKLPEDLRALEPYWRDAIQKRVQRGKVDLFLRLKAQVTNAALSLNSSFVDALMEQSRKLVASYPELKPLNAANVLSWPGALSQSEQDNESLRALANQVLQNALDEFDAARAREGDKLVEVLRERVQQLQELRAKALAVLPQIRTALKDKLSARMAELQGSLEPGRLEAELVLNLQKLDVDEELERLRIHLIEVTRVLGSAEPIGRRLDFLVQELHRECNTFGAKSVDAGTSQISVDMKVIVEQIREQVQNLE